VTKNTKKAERQKRGRGKGQNKEDQRLTLEKLETKEIFPAPHKPINWGRGGNERDVPPAKKTASKTREKKGPEQKIRGGLLIQWKDASFDEKQRQ